MSLQWILILVSLQVSDYYSRIIRVCKSFARMTRFFSTKQAYLYEQVLLPNRDEYDFRIKSGVGKSDRCKLAWFQVLGRDGPGNWTGIIETLIFLLQGPDQRLHSFPSILTSSTLALSFSSISSNFICFFGFPPLLENFDHDPRVDVARLVIVSLSPSVTMGSTSDELH